MVARCHVPEGNGRLPEQGLCGPVAEERISAPVQAIHAVHWRRALPVLNWTGHGLRTHPLHALVQAARRAIDNPSDPFVFGTGMAAERYGQASPGHP